MIEIETLTQAAFAPYGDILDASGDYDKLINQGLCKRFNDRAKLEFEQGAAGISIFAAEIRSLPLALEMMERHPQGSQAFIPMSSDPFLVVVADSPTTTPRAFRTQSGQGINFHKGTWHGVLTPLSGSGLFAVIDRIGPGQNLEEHWFDKPYLIC